MSIDREDGERWLPADPAAGLRAVLNALPAMVGYWDRDLRNRMANDAYMRYFGRRPEEMHGIHIREVLGEELFAKNFPYMQRALAGEEQLFDREIPTPSGELRYTQASYIPDVADDGAVNGFFVLVTDITDRRRAELALHTSEERYRRLIDQLPGGVITVVEPDLRISWIGGGATKTSLFDAAALVGRPIRETSGGGEHGLMVEQLYRRALDGEHVVSEVHSQVTDRDFHVEIGPLRGADGAVMAALGVAEDITVRKRFEADLLLHRHVTDNMAEGAMLMRASDFGIVYANRTAEAMFGYGAGGLVGLTVDALNAPDGLSPAEVAAMVAANVDAGQGRWQGDIRSRRADGSVFWRHSSVSRFLHDELGELLLTIQTDVTERRRREADEAAHAALATLVAEGAGPAAVFNAVADQLNELFTADRAVVVRHDSGAPHAEILAAAGEGAAGLVGRDVTLSGRSLLATAAQDGSAVRTTLEAEDPLGFGRAIAMAVTVAGSRWGTLAVDFGDAPIATGALERLERLTRLTAMAIANAEALNTLARQAATDSITGLANHRSFHQALHVEIARARRYERDLSVVLLDVDHFKRINDTFGHPEGDRVLAEIGRRLQAQAREGDLVARIGGEEFAFLMPETSGQAALAAAERIRRAIAEEPFEPVGDVTISAGICGADHGHDAETLMRFADRALYWAKDGGRNASFIYTPEAHATLASASAAAERFQTMSSIRALARVIDAKDISTRRHSERVGQLAERLALSLGWTAKRARQLHDCGLLHDVGKIAIPEHVLLKPAHLTDEEFELVKPHAALSAQIAAEVMEGEQVAWIRSHHERWDGTGYPDGLAGDDIPDGAQLLAMADAWDVMTQARTYKAARTVEDARGEVRAQRGKQFAPEAVDALLAIEPADTPPGDRAVPGS